MTGARIALIAASIFAAVLYFLTDKAGSESWTGKILESLMFGFTPAFAGLAYASIAKWYRGASAPDTYRKDLHRVWGVFVVMIALERFIAFWRLLQLL